RDGENGHAAPVAIVQPVDQVQIPRAAAPGADGQTPGEMRLRAGGKRRRLLVSHVHPADLVVSANGVGDTVEGVARDSIHPRDTSGNEGVDQQVRDRLLPHGAILLVWLTAPGEMRRDPASPGW